MKSLHHRRFCLLAIPFIFPPAVSSETPDTPQSLFRDGAAAMKARNAAPAETAFRKATELDPTFAPAHLDLGLAELKEGKLLEAIASIKKSLELDPSSPGAHLFLGIAEYQSNDAESALVNLRQEL